jgi:hypothetical protein
MRNFDYFLSTDAVRKVLPDKSFAKALLQDAVMRLAFVKNSNLSEENAKYLLEDAYEALREAADAQLAISGFKSYSHEASIAYLQKFKELSSTELERFDALRKKRNDVKYYAKKAISVEARQAIEFADQLLLKLKIVIEKQL